MRELDRTNETSTSAILTCAIVGAGRLGTALADALRTSNVVVFGPLGRNAIAPNSVDVVLLCVPDAEIEAAASLVPPGPLVGHCSGASGLGVFNGREGFGMHPLMTFPPDQQGLFAGAGCAIAGSSPRALKVAEQLATHLSMHPFELLDADRATYHAGAAFASNFVVTLAAAAERLVGDAGVSREHLLPIMHAAVTNWGTLGTAKALTGPIVRGDELTVTNQRSAIAENEPDLLQLFDSFVAATRALSLANSKTTKN